MPRIRQRARGLNKALEQERKREEELANQLTLKDQLSEMVNENREYFLEKVNDHLENLLDNAKKDNDIPIKMAKHYAMRDKIARAKLKRAHGKIESLTRKEEKKRLDILAKASIHA